MFHRARTAFIACCVSTDPKQRVYFFGDAIFLLGQRTVSYLWVLPSWTPFRVNSTFYLVWTHPKKSIKASCLNIQVSMKSKLTQLDNLLRDQAHPPIVLLTESGVPPHTLTIDSRYVCFSKPVARNQLGTTVLLLRDTHTTVHRVEHHPGGRGLYIEARVLGDEFWLIVLYCPAKPYERLEETTELIQWAALRTLTRPAFTSGVVEGDFNCNSWSSFHPLAAKPLVDLPQDCCIESDTCGVRRVCDAPTWYNTAGLSRCIDHCLVSSSLWAGAPRQSSLSTAFRLTTVALPAVFDQDPVVE